MSLRVNSDQTLMAILQNKKIFYALMDSVKESVGSLSNEFTIGDYDRLLDDAGRMLASSSDRQKILDALCLENLHRNGLLIYLDQKVGIFRLQAFVLDMLQHLDSKRIRELSSADLQQLWKQLEECYRQVCDPTIMWIPDDNDYEEMLSTVYSTFQHVASELRKNIRGLRGKTEDLARIVEDVSEGRMEKVEQVRRALDSIILIHERHVTPTLEFLDQYAGLNGKSESDTLSNRGGPMALVREIIQKFDDRNKDIHVSRLQRIHFHIMSFAKEASEIAECLSVYVRFAERERKRYDRAETLFNDLLEAVRKKQTGNLRDYLLQPEDPVFAPMRAIGPLKSFLKGQSSNINWPKEGGIGDLAEMLRVKVQAYRDRSSPGFVEAEAIPPHSKQERLERTMLVRIREHLRDFDLSRCQGELFKSVHEYMADRMDDYELHMLFDAVGLIQEEGEPAYMSLTECMVIEFKGKRLRYRPVHPHNMDQAG